MPTPRSVSSAIQLRKEKNDEEYRFLVIDDNDLGQWTLLTNSLNICKQTTWLFQFAGRILKLGKFAFVQYVVN